MESAERERFNDWLQERGIEAPRRVVRVTERGILVSKFEAGFAEHLHDVLGRIAEKFDDAAVSAAYAEQSKAEPGSTRVATWHAAARAVLESAVAGGEVSRDEASEVEAGLDSVAALLDSVLWSSPVAGEAWIPSAAERAAFDDALARMDDANSLFTRHYGEFEGRRVENHCPGAWVARRLLEQAWTLCTAPAPMSPA